MKHVRTLSTPRVRPAQSPGEIVTIIGTIMSGLGAVLLSIAPLIGGGKGGS